MRRFIDLPMSQYGDEAMGRFDDVAMS